MIKLALQTIPYKGEKGYALRLFGALVTCYEGTVARDLVGCTLV